MNIPALKPIEVKPRPLNKRLWTLISKDIAGTATADELAELNSMMKQSEGDEE
jgi:hypothetical protein